MSFGYLNWCGLNMKIKGNEKFKRLKSQICSVRDLIWKNADRMFCFKRCHRPEQILSKILLTSFNVCIAINVLQATLASAQTTLACRGTALSALIRSITIASRITLWNCNYVKVNIWIININIGQSKTVARWNKCFQSPQPNSIELETFELWQSEESPRRPFPNGIELSCRNWSELVNQGHFCSYKQVSSEM